MTYSHVRYAESGLVKEMRDDVRVVYGPSVNPPESRARHTLAATFLLAFAMLFAAALPAQAQTTIWSATLTPRVTLTQGPPYRWAVTTPRRGMEDAATRTR